MSIYLFFKLQLFIARVPQLPWRSECLVVENWPTLGASSGKTVSHTKKLTGEEHTDRPSSNR